MKKRRQEAVLRIIKEFEVETQEALIQKLNDAGFSATQATISRDIKELGLVKSASQYGGYKYVQNTDSKSNTHKFVSIFRDSVTGADYAGYTVVLKSYSGMANAACAAIDSMHFEGIVGTLAGDDTVFVLCRTETMAQSLFQEMQSLLSD